MNGPRRIVFSPVGDASHRAALKEAVSFASALPITAMIDMLTVIPESSTWDRLTHPDHVNSIIDDQTSSWTSTLQRWTNEFELIDGFDVKVGSIADTIARRALEVSADLIILSAGHESSDMAVVRRVMRRAECPVWLLRPTRAKTRRILAAVNPEPDELELNLAIIKEATDLATTLAGELSLMASWVLYGEQTMRRSAFIHTPIEDYHDLYNLREKTTARGLAELAEAAHTSAECELIVEHGVSAPTILETIRRRRINLLVIGTVGRAGLSGLLLGNTAEDLADSAPCSVFAVKPPGFRSPLR